MAQTNLKLAAYQNLPNFPSNEIVPFIKSGGVLKHLCLWGKDGNPSGPVGGIVFPVENWGRGRANIYKPLSSPICQRCGRRPARPIRNFLWEVIQGKDRTPVRPTFYLQGLDPRVLFMYGVGLETTYGDDGRCHQTIGFRVYDG